MCGLRNVQLVVRCANAESIVCRITISETRKQGHALPRIHRLIARVILMRNECCDFILLGV